ncbi:site-specific DNA-methyltransferase [Mucilaginibacter sp. dw_454]|uniref:DNA-methyltransferase n=1 Tax=Mucilaginibacter sp. dw_454 TaxID=2720079 RepID=UPI001BD55AA0|nr:site-specific DNA-methyltransferase [Mucilaginibacter sp. dw_454]
MIAVNQIYHSDCLTGLRSLPDDFVQCCITSPPYWRLRDYGVAGQLGSEDTPEEYIKALTEIFSEVKRVLKPEGTLWLNLGDAYWGSGKAGKNSAYQAKHREFGKSSKNIARFGQPTTGKHAEIKNKDLIGLPWMVAFALRKQGWYLRQDIIWHKPNHMPESVTDRCTKAHEYVFLFSKSPKYYFDHTAIKTPAKGKTIADRTSRMARKAPENKLVNCFRKERGPYDTANRRSVWSIITVPFKGAHSAAFPPELPELCLKAGSREGDIVLDPFMGAGTTALAATRLNRQYIGFEINPGYIQLAEERISSSIKL